MRAVTYFYLLCCLAVSAELLKATENFQEFIPKDHSGQRVGRHLSTLLPNGSHPLSTTFLLSVFGQQYVVDLTLNRRLIPSTFVQIHYSETNNKIITRGVENCFYHGKIRGYSDSNVILSTCQGLSGIFYHGNDDSTYFYIEPGDSTDDGHIHIIYRASDLTERNVTEMCGEFNHSHILFSPPRILQQQAAPRHRLRRDVVSEEKVIELVLVNDNRQFLIRGSNVNATAMESVAVANMIDGFYKYINTRVALLAVEVWNTRDQIVISSKPDETLDAFLEYRKADLLPICPHDTGHLITGIDFDGSTAGLATLGGVCSRTGGGGVNQYLGATSRDVFSAILAHELGHNLNMNHDNDRGCTCADGNLQCIMSATLSRTPPDRFSSCSEEDYHSFLQSGFGTCLFNRPSKLFGNPVCGNGFVETGEACDCGSPEECAAANDSCCNPSTCRLHDQAQCADGLCCSPNCQFLSTDVLCRDAAASCDLPEYCSGTSADCPANARLQDGTPCEGDSSYCYNGQCLTHEKQCHNIWGSNATVGDDICYNFFNKKGDQFGYCSIDNDGNYVACTEENVRCGILYCFGGLTVPSFSQAFITYFTRTLTFGSGVSIQCKGAHIDFGEDVASLGLVEDGTKCDENKICLKQSCASLSSLDTRGQCPVGENGQTCSGKGVCNDHSECTCNVGFSPPVCAPKSNTTSAPVPTSATSTTQARTDPATKDGIVTTAVFTTASGRKVANMGNSLPASLLASLPPTVFNASTHALKINK
ncbi:disintegrin and metalloproteinase domain-containing protein 12-like [Oscarella lobularis]|uniref:disintegrin and metalloproteinase domain-containing protein 12-like n=1 Tax=Oscarella lobularis TaxID=121494 RepID=UPI0033132CF2